MSKKPLKDMLAALDEFREEGVNKGVQSWEQPVFEKWRYGAIADMRDGEHSTSERHRRMVGYLSQNYLCFNNRELIQETLNDLSLDVLKQTLASILKAPLVRLMVLNKDTQAGYKGDFFQSNAGLPGAFFNRADLDGRCKTVTPIVCSRSHLSVVSSRRYSSHHTN